MAKRTAKIYRPTPRNLARLAHALREGELVAVPTETVYGLAADALNAAACRKIFRAKRRPTSDPLIVHLAKASDLTRVAEASEAVWKLAKHFWPGPLTLVLPRKPIVPELVTAGLPSVAVRVPRHAAFRRLIALAGTPLAAPSANPFGYVSPTNADHVLAGLGSRISHILDGGASRIGLESTIVDLRDPTQPKILRPGAISADEISAVLGVPVAARKPARAKKTRAQIAPGLLTRHYSPRTPVSLHSSLTLRDVARSTGGKREAWVFLAKPAGKLPPNVFWLDRRGSLAGVARRLFGVLRELDGAGYQHLHVERASGDGLAIAINDRLERAAAKA